MDCLAFSNTVTLWGMRCIVPYVHMISGLFPCTFVPHNLSHTAIEQLNTSKISLKPRKKKPGTICTIAHLSACNWRLSVVNVLHVLLRTQLHSLCLSEHL